MNYYYRFSLIALFSLFTAVVVFNFEIFREEEVFSSVRDISIDDHPSQRGGVVIALVYTTVKLPL